MRVTHDELLLFGKRLRRRRNELGMTQEFISDKVNISLRFYQMIERGEKSLSVDTLISLSRTLNVSVDYLIFGDLPRGPDNPLTGLLSSLSPQQKNDALEILRLYASGCGAAQSAPSAQNCKGRLP